MYCRVELNTAYTVDLIGPYVLNRVYVPLGLVAETMNFLLKTNLNDANLFTDFNSNKHIC